MNIDDLIELALKHDDDKYWNGCNEFELSLTFDGIKFNSVSICYREISLSNDDETYTYSVDTVGFNNYAVFTDSFSHA